MAQLDSSGRRWRLTPRAYQRVTLAALVALGFIIVSGGAVRLTGSGLGCPNWPTCTDHVVAPVSYHPMVEFVNRTVTGLVSAAVIVAVLGSVARLPRRRDLTVLSFGLVAGVVAQIVLGGETVKHRLNPAFVQAHFLLSMLIVWDAVVLHHRAGLPDAGPHRPPVDRDLVRVGRLTVLMTAATVVLGTVVTGAGPHSGANSGDVEHGRVQRWQLDLHRVTQLHGLSAILLLVLVLATLWLLRAQQAPAAARRRALLVLEALSAQIAIGYTQYFTGVPPAIVAVHLLGAVLVWVAVLRFALALGSGVGTPTPAPPPGPPAVPARAAGAAGGPVRATRA